MAKSWKCVSCGTLVLADERPKFEWDDGHICYFMEEQKIIDFAIVIPALEKENNNGFNKLGLR
jgi:hypothetical protein